MSELFTQFSITQINRDLNKKVVRIVHTLLDLPESVPFRKPVPHKALKLQDYKSIVKKPVDLNLIRRQNNEGKYKSVEELLDDIQLCWENCKLYNSPDSELYAQAQILEKEFFKLVREAFPDFPYEKIEDILAERKLRLMERAFILEEKQKVESKNREKVQKCEVEPVELSQHSESKRMLKQPSKPAAFPIEPLQTIQPEESNPPPSIHQEQSDPEIPQLPPADPIFVNLKETPTRQQLITLSRSMKEAGKNSLQQILEILYDCEKDLVDVENGTQMTFSMNNIHLSTYMKLCKVLKIEGGETLIE